MSFFERFKVRLQKFFYGRYGGDALNIFLLAISLIVMYIPYVRLLSYPILIYVIFRTLSKNLDKRRVELNWYNKNIGNALVKAFYAVSKFFTGIGSWFKRKRNTHKQIQSQKNDFVFFKCNSCGNMLRVPKNKGKIKITCPVCKKTTEKTT